MSRKDFAARLLATFLGELEEQLRAMNADLLALEEAPTDPERLRSLFRAAHTLKGAARAAGVPLVEAACHALETLLDKARDGRVTLSAADFELLFTSVDAMTDAAARLRAGEPLEPSPIAELVRDLGGARPTARARATTPSQKPMSPPRPPSRPPPPRPTESAAERAPAAGGLADAPVRVESDKLDALVGSAGELLVATGRLSGTSSKLRELQELAGRCMVQWRDLARTAATSDARARLEGDLDRLVRELGRLAGRASTDARSMAQLAGGLGENMRRLRMRPFADACETLPRTVRDLATAAGKEVRLEVRGGEVEADRAVLDGVREALLHLVRNAVDHGIEPPGERETRGKARAGRVEVDASIHGDRLVVMVADDGAGLDTQALRAKLERRGTAAPSDDAQLARMLFEGGLSTRAQADEISGRGVGLDAARAAVERVRGRIEVRWTPGAGTTFVLENPLTLAMVRVVLVAVGEHVVALPSTDVERMERVAPESIRRVDGRDVLPDPEAPLPLVSLARLLGPPFAERPVDGPVHVVRVRVGERRIALAVDGLIAEREVMLRPVDRLTRSAPRLAGAALLDDGTVALVLRSAVLVTAGLSADGPGLRWAARAAEPATRPMVLVVDDSITTRGLEHSVLEAAGYRVLTAADGAAAWELLQESKVDLVVSDVEMPRMDGFALCEAVRASKRLQSLPIVLVTALESPEHRARGLEAGADAYLPKSSFDQRELLETIAQLLGRPE